VSVGDEAILGIQDAAHEAFVAAFDGFPLSEENSEAEQEAVADFTDRAHAAAHEAVRTASAKFGVEPGDYYRADPGAASGCEPECAQKWPEVSVEMINRDPLGKYLAWFETQRILSQEDQTTDLDGSLRAETAQEEVDTLDEEPPTDDLGSGTGIGY